MTEPAPEPTLTDAELDQLIIAAGKELSLASRTRPRDAVRIDAARAELERLKAMQNA